MYKGLEHPLGGGGVALGPISTHTEGQLYSVSWSEVLGGSGLGLDGPDAGPSLFLDYWAILNR